MIIRTDSHALGNRLELNITQNKTNTLALFNGYIYNDRHSETYIESKVTTLKTTNEHNTLIELQNILVSTLRTLKQYCELAPSVTDQLFENTFELDTTPKNLCLYPFPLQAHIDINCVTLTLKVKCDSTNVSLTDNIFEIKLATTATEYDYYFFTNIIKNITTLVTDLMFELNRVINHQTNCIK